MVRCLRVVIYQKLRYSTDVNDHCTKPVRRVYLEALGGKICSLKEMPGPNLKWRKRFIIKIHSKCCISVTQDTLTCDFYIVKQILREEITHNLKLFMLTHLHFSAISRIFKVHFQIHLFLTIQFHMISGFPVLWL